MSGKHRFFRRVACAVAAGALCSVPVMAADGGWRQARGALPKQGGQAVQVRHEAGAPDVQRLVYEFPAPAIATRADGTVDVVMPSLDVGGKAGAPALPVMAARVAVPQGHEIVSIRLLPGKANEVRLGAPVRHMREPYPLSRPDLKRDTPRDAALYGSNDAYPAAPYRSRGLQFKRGVGFADLVLSPVAYRPKSGRLTWYGEIVVEVRTRASAAQAGTRAPHARFRSANDAAAAAVVVDNPSTAAAYVAEPLAAAPASAGAVPAGVPGPQPLLNLGETLPCRVNDYRYVIITDDYLSDAFLTVLFLRQSEGLTGTIVTIEDIVQKYPSVVDDAESMRDFIRDAYDKWGTEYVLLGGGIDALPVRYLFAQAADAIDFIPSDVYFQCLDGSYDSNGDGIFGESTDGADRTDGRPGDDVDLYAELAIGRVPVTYWSDVFNWTEKQMQYEFDRRAGTAPYLGGALMVGEYLGFGGVSDYATGSMEEIRLGANTNGYRTAGFTSLNIFTNIQTLYDSPTNTWVNTDLSALVDSEQFSVLNHLGHCNIDYLMKSTTGESDAIYGNDRPFFVYSQGCFPGAFDYDTFCVGVYVLTQMRSGTFGEVLNARYGWGFFDSTDGPSQRYNRWFWHVFFGEGTPRIGILNQGSHEHNAPRIDEDCMRWCFYESNLLGDPAQQLYGIDNQVLLDREAYRSDAAANVDVRWTMADPAVLSTDVRLTMLNGTNVVGQTNVVCLRMGSVGRLSRFLGGPVPLPALHATNGFLLRAQWALPTATNLVYTDTAPIDDIPPVISNLRQTDATDVSMTLAWDTDELAFGGAALGDQLPPNYSWFTQSHAAYATNHSESFTGLDSFSRYYTYVWAEDYAGNRTNFPANILSANPDNYPWFATRGRETVAAFSLDRSDAGWTVSNINGAVCWEYGAADTYGPADGTRCWGTILNGRYPAGANATVSSPFFNVRLSPVVRFRHWFDIRRTDVYDVGYIEVFADGVWHNVTRYSDARHDDSVDGRDVIYGGSGGWKDVTVTLPAEFENKAVAVRFRLTSDNYDPATKPAGWYVDDFVVSDVPNSGLGISGCAVTDSGSGFTGDNDGIADPGETVGLRLQLFNYSTNILHNVRGTLVVLVEGNPDDRAKLIDGSPASVTYGEAYPGRFTNSFENVRLQLAPDLSYGTVVTILQTLVDDIGRRYETRFDLPIEPLVSMSGLVRDIGTHAPIAQAVLTAEANGRTFSTLSDAGGNFRLVGLYSNTWYKVAASRPGLYSAIYRMVQAPATGVVFELGRAQAIVVPTDLTLAADAGGFDQGTFAVSNAAAAAATLNFNVQQVRYDDVTGGWLAVAPLQGSVVPGTALTVRVTASAQTILPGVYHAHVVLSTDDPLLPTAEVRVTFNVGFDPWLAYGGYFEDNDTDGDGHIESGETGDLFFYLQNTNGASDAVSVHGLLSPLTNVVALVTNGNVSWHWIPAFGTMRSDNGVGIQLAPGIPDGALLPMQLDVWTDNHPTNTFRFDFVHHIYGVLTGRVEVTWAPAAGTTNGIVTPATNAVVTAVSTNGTMHRSLPADTNGVYTIAGLPIGNYWCKVVPPFNYPYVAPAGINVPIVAQTTTNNFMLNDYGTNAPHLLFYTAVIDDSVTGDNDGGLDAGETVRVYTYFYNDGLISALNVTGRLAVADMGAGVGPYMDVVDDRAEVGVLAPSSPPWLWPPNAVTNAGGFTVRVHPDARIGDMQRFWLWEMDGFNPTRVWPLDFALTVAPLYRLAGHVLFTNPADNTPTNFARLLLSVDFPGGPLASLPANDGAFSFPRLPSGVRAVVSVRVPSGFLAPDPQIIDPLDADHTNLVFLVRPSNLGLDPSAFDLTVAEGTSATQTLTVGNNSISNETVTLNVSYARQRNDTLRPDPVLADILAATPADWAALDPEQYVAGEIEIRFKDGTGWMARQACLERHGLRALFHFDLIPACLAVPRGTATAASATFAGMVPLARALASDPSIQYVQPSRKALPTAVPNDPLYPEMYGLHNTRQTGGTYGADIGAEAAWNITTGSQAIVVAVCDTGVEWTHDDLRDNVWSNPLDQPGDVNGDGYPGVAGVDDDGDAEAERWNYDPLTGITKGPETISPLFDPEMWRDDEIWTRVPPDGHVAMLPGHDGVPDFFQRDYNGDGVPDVYEDSNGNGIPDLFESPPFNDADHDGVPDIFADKTGPGGIPDGIPDIFGDEDGDGVINENGIDFRDQHVMTAIYTNGVPLCTQKLVPLSLPGGLGTYIVLVEQWDADSLKLAAMDDDENGYADDVHGWCFADWDNDVLNHAPSGHGTHVAGTIGAVGNNGIGVCGVNWHVKIMPLSLTYHGGTFTTYARIAKSMEYAIKQGARVSNHSYGGGGTAGVLYEILKTAEQRYPHHLFVMAAGNSAQNLDMTRDYPAYYSTVLNNIVTVAATDANDQLAWFSNFGRDSVQIAAPGVDILSTLPWLLQPGTGGAPLAGAYGRLSGTSMAAPHVTGAAALVWSLAPEADYEAVKKALLDGARKDANLDGWVKSGGHLNVSRALRLFNNNWIRLSTNRVSVAPGGSVPVTVAFNPDLSLVAGDYQATIQAFGLSLGNRDVPVNLTVTPQPLPEFAAVNVVSDTDGDGYAEPGETVAFTVTLRNKGTFTYVGLQGLLTSLTAGVGVLDGSAAWDTLYGGDTGTSLDTFQVTIPAGAPPTCAFRLDCTAPGVAAQTVSFALPTVPRYRASGRVVNTAAAGVGNATVEYWGGAAGRTQADTNGFYAINGLLGGAYHCRAIPTNYARSAIAAFIVTNTNVALPNLIVTRTATALSTNRLDAIVQKGLSATARLTITNAAGADGLNYRVEVMPALKVGVFSDGTSLGPLVAPLQRMGFNVDYYTNNFAFVQYYNPVYAYYELVPTVRYTWDDARVFAYDVVVADVSGPAGAGRLLTAEEGATLSNYVARGGTLLVTGVNPLTIPDNPVLAQICGLAVANRDSAATNAAVAATNFLGYFVSVFKDERLAVTNQAYDLAPATNTTVFFTAGNGNKLLRRMFPIEQGGGMACLWTGNPSDSDWGQEGAWQDVLRELLRARCFEDAALQVKVPWLHLAGASTGTVSAAGSRTLTFTLNDSLLAEPDTYKAVAVILGNYPGEETLAVPIAFEVAPSTLRVFTSGRVTDWRGLPLRGDGGPASCLYQVIYAGTNGVPEPPNTADGAPTGDDEVLATFVDSVAFGRFGDGTQLTPDSGTFDKLFAHTFPAGSSNKVVYVRAWDAASFTAALAYGDSTARHAVVYAPWEQADFGSWGVTNVIDYFRDSNGDSVPDGWIMKYRPDLDPRAAVTALTSVATSSRILSVPKQKTSDPAPKPYRVAVPKADGNVIFALDQANNRIVTLHTNNAFAAKTFRPQSGGNDLWGAPEGLAADPRPGQYRVAVADTSHHYVYLYTYNTNTWVFTQERKIGLGLGSGAGYLNRPAGVAFDGTGRLFVADRLNNRVAIFNAGTGAWIGSFQGSGSHVLSGPQGVCVDDDVDGGVWVADTANNRLALYTAGGTYSFLRGLGSIGSGDGQFQSPVDVQIWRMGTNGVKRLVVADKTNGRLQVFKGTTHLVNVGSIGTLTGQLSLPSGVWPIDNNPILVVADTGNGRIQWFSLALDADQDGMDDFWEDLHGLNSSVNDAAGDPDHDLVSNIGEFLTRGDPQNPDSNGNGGSDGWELANGLLPDGASHPVHPPHVVSLTAQPGTNLLGDTVAIQATFDQAVANTPVHLQLSGGTSTNLLLVRASTNQYVYAYVVQAGDNGWVDAALSGVWSINVPGVTADPPVYTKTNLFLVLALAAAVQNVTVTPAVGATGTNVTISVTFSDGVQNGTPRMTLAGAVNIGPMAMTRIDDQHYQYVYPVSGIDGSGMTTVTIGSALTQGSGLPVPTYAYPDAFAIFFNPFAIAMIGNPGSGLQLQWQAEAGAKYQILTNANLLAPAAWGVKATVTATGNPETYAPVGVPGEPALFYRLQRINP